MGNVYIHQAITRFDGVIISSGTICTAAIYSSWNYSYSCPYTNIRAPQLVINGSLISLNESKPIQFRRTLDPAAGINNTNSPAEQINHQVKYLVI
ncbi:MAG: hypothetical protein HYT83_01435, partial [Candidatus Levybacteria bacterium]|nr:hypothetical protein [Candidatus Levybacteria bacterium]